MDTTDSFLKMVRRMGTYGGRWEEQCPDEKRWYFVRDGKHSFAYATVNWETRKVCFRRERRTA